MALAATARARFAPCALLFCAGALSVLAFAPFDLFPLAFLSLALLVRSLDGAPSGRSGFIYGLAWGAGAFLAGVSWLYVALNRYGGMPMPLAGLAILLFCLYLALYPALAGALYARFKSGGRMWRAAFFAALWAASEWLRGVVFTGFPWLAMAYSQTPPSPLAGYLPVLGVYGTSLILAFLAALVALAAWCWMETVAPRRHGWREKLRRSATDATSRPGRARIGLRTKRSPFGNA